MRLSEIKQQIAWYDHYKGRGRRIFGDAKQIKVLKKFVKIEEQRIKDSGESQDPDIKYDDFLLFNNLGRRGLADLSAKYLQSERASTKVFKLWQQENNQQEDKEIDISALPMLRQKPKPKIPSLFLQSRNGIADKPPRGTDITEDKDERENDETIIDILLESEKKESEGPASTGISNM